MPLLQAEQSTKWICSSFSWGYNKSNHRPCIINYLKLTLTTYWGGGWHICIYIKVHLFPSPTRPRVSNHAASLGHNEWRGIVQGQIYKGCLKVMPPNCSHGNYNQYKEHNNCLTEQILDYKTPFFNTVTTIALHFHQWWTETYKLRSSQSAPAKMMHYLNSFYVVPLDRDWFYAFTLFLFLI